MLTLVLAAALGVFAWTFIEYVFHRFVGHEWKRKTNFQVEHLKHHRKRDYFATNRDKALLALKVMSLILLLTVPIVGWAHGAVFGAGIVGSYLVYEVIHRSLHVREPRTAYGRWARRHHLAHHHMNPMLNHGVTSPLWDHVFGTFLPSENVRIPASKAPGWLTEDAPDRDSYELVGRSQAA